MTAEEAVRNAHEWFEVNSGWAPPDEDTVAEWLADGVCRCPDECLVAPEGWCGHGLASWHLILEALAVSASGRRMNEHIYHLALRDAWDAAVAQGTPYRRSTVDRALDEEGFIHCSFRHQVEGVADRFYRGRTDVLLLTIDPSLLGAEVRTEGEGRFPHVYGPLPIGAVVGVVPVACGDDGRLLVGQHLD